MTADELDTAWYKLQFGVRRSIRYHRRRSAFFDLLDAIFSLALTALALLILYGACAGQSQVWLLTVAVLLVLLIQTNLVIAPSYHQWHHRDLAWRFADLETRLLTNPDEGLLHRFTADRLTIEMSEPPILRVLDSLCHNEQLRAEGLDEYRMKIGFWQRLCAPLFDLHAGKIG